MNKKNIVLLIAVVIVGMLVAGGTYAVLLSTMNVTNGNYSSKVDCFTINYDKGQNITGTLFPAVDYNGGLSSSVSLSISSSCAITGTGNLIIHIDDETSETLLGEVSGHCEERETLKYLSGYDENTCIGENMWVNNGTALKYAIFNTNSTTGTPLTVGYIKNYGDNITDGFAVNNSTTNATYYLYIWMDGYLIDNNYNNLSFSGYLDASVTQNDIR